MAQTSKERHEAFVSNLQGGDLSEVFAVSAVSALLFVFSAGLKPFFTRFHLAVDFFFAVIPSLLLVTVLANHVFRHLFLLLFLLLPFLALLLRGRNRHMTPTPPTRSLVDARGHSASISCFRGLMLFCTAVCILGVDFPAFPRRFAKAETFGTGLMDVGVGSFAVGMGLVSAQARSIAPQVLRTLRSTVAPLLVLGALRTASVKAADYQEHVSEYGVHWNFFITLALSQLLVTVIHSIVRDRFSPLYTSIFVTLLHVVQLRLSGQAWALEAPRTSFLSANKEGLVSLPAYAALELWGAWLGLELRKGLRSDRGSVPLVRIAALLFSVTVGGGLLTYILSPVSRRFGNAAYMSWAVSNTAMTILIFLGGQIVVLGDRPVSSPPSPPSLLGSGDLLGSLNRFGMFHFLAANLITGLVNKSLDTLSCGNLTALCILICYQAALLIAVGAYDAFCR